jgi:STE24 endopeptidase
MMQAVMPQWLARWGVRGIADIAGFPVMMLALSLIGLIGMPLQNAVSRAFEWEADRFAVTITGKSAAFASALRRLGELNLADPAPPKWIEWLFYDHPPVMDRIKVASLEAKVAAPLKR